jgi:hypothetical protein
MGKLPEQSSNLLDFWNVFGDEITLLYKKRRPALEISHRKRRQEAPFNQC